MEAVSIYKVFVASPGDTKKERDSMGEVIEEINQTHGPPLNYRLELLRWEENVFPNAGRPQQVINDQVTAYNIFVGLMWHRFGSPTGVADSGTAEEYDNAYRKWRANPDELVLMFYFNQEAYTLSTEEEVSQVAKVISFKKRIRAQQLSWDYTGASDFQAKIRKHLCAVMNSKKKMLVGKATSNNDEIIAFRSIWPSMDKSLQDALSIAYNENRLAGDGGIKTKDLFAALLLNNADDLKPLVDEIPRKALPEPTQGEVIKTPYLMEERPWLSHCITSSIDRLSKSLKEGEKLTSLDIFVDIAKNGTGESVRQLRSHNIGPEEIDAILKKKKLSVLSPKVN